MTTKVISKNFRAVKVNKVCYRDRHSFHVLASHFTSLLSFLVFVREECTERFKRQWPEVVLYKFLLYSMCLLASRVKADEEAQNKQDKIN